MKTKLELLFRQLMRSPQRFPVEAALGVLFFIFSVIGMEFDSMNDIWPVLAFFVPLVSISFWLQPINRKAYLLSFFLFIPLLVIKDLEDYLFTFGFAFTYVLAGILLIVGNGRKDNRSFVAHALHVCTQMFLGFVIAGIFNLVVMAIVASFCYIFGIATSEKLYL